MLRRSEILDTILALKQESSLGLVRDGVLRIQEQVRRHPRESIELGSSVPRLSRRFLVEELQQIAESQTLERARYYLERLEKGVTQSRTSAVNDINLNRWKEYEDVYLDSLWVVPRRESSGVHTAGYWGNFIPQIPHQMMRRYTKRGEWILDAFLGSGTTLIESQRLGRNGLGIELQPSVLQRARSLVANEPNKFGVVTETIEGDASAVDVRETLARHGQKSVQLLVMHPPYHDIIKFSDDPRDLSNATSVPDFLDSMARVVCNTARVLDKGRYFALVIGDKYAHGEWVPLGFFTMNRVLELGFSLKSIIVKNFEDTAGKRQQKELWKYRALVGGFYIFKHEYIFLFKKR